MFLSILVKNVKKNIPTREHLRETEQHPGFVGGVVFVFGLIVGTGHE